MAIGAFQATNGGFTLSNVRIATHGVYLHGFGQSIELSVIAAVLPGIFGLLDVPSAETPAPGSAVAVSMTEAPVLVTARR